MNLKSFFFTFLTLSVFIVSCQNEEDEPMPISDPTADFSFSPEEPTRGTTVTFTNQSTNADTYAWSSEPSGFSSTEASPTHVFEEAGTYEITLTATNEAGETASVTKTLTVISTAPVANFEVADIVLIGNEVSFVNSSANVNANTRYEWSTSPNSFTSSEENPSFTFTEQAIEYTVTLRVTNESGESDEVSKTISVENNPSAIDGIASASLVNRISENFQSGWFTGTQGDSVRFENTNGNYRMFNNTQGNWWAWQSRFFSGLDQTKNFEMKIRISKLVSLEDGTEPRAFMFMGLVDRDDNGFDPDAEQLYYALRLADGGIEVGSGSGVSNSESGITSETIASKVDASLTSFEEDKVFTLRHFNGELFLFVGNELIGSGDYSPFLGPVMWLQVNRFTEIIYKDLSVQEIQ